MKGSECIVITIRRENIGIVLYSYNKKSYYLIQDVDDVDCIMKYLRTGDKKIIKDKLRAELDELDFFSEEKRVVNNLNTHEYPIGAPLEYYFDFTNKCNLRCTHCYNREYLGSTTMNYDKIKSIIKDMYDCGIMRIHLAGGEPTIDKIGLKIYMETANKYKIVSSLSSNGVDIDDEIFDIILDNDVFSLTISLEGANDQSNGKIRGYGNFDRSVDTIRRFILKRNLKNKSTLVCMKISYNNLTPIEEFDKFVELGKKIGVDIIKFANPERCLLHERGFYGKQISEYYKTLLNINAIKEKYKNDIYISVVSNPFNNCNNIGIPEMRGCIGGQELLAINPDGRISPCLMDQINLGNIYNYNSIKDMYFNEKINEYRNLSSNYSCSDDDCQYHSKCRGGCQVRKIVEYGAMIEKDPLCIFNFDDRKKEKAKIKSKKVSKINILHSL